MKAITKAIEIAGGQASLARKCRVSQTAAWKWAKGKGISAESALLIEAATEGAVSKHDLRPDIFGPAPGVPPAKTEAA